MRESISGTAVRVLLFVLFCCYFFWSQTDRVSGQPMGEEEIPPVQAELRTIGYPYPQTNHYVAISPVMRSRDYRSEHHSCRRLAGYLTRAKEAQILDEATLVVLPPNIGTGLVFADQKGRTYSEANRDGVYREMVLSNALQFGWAFIVDQDHHRALLRMRSNSMARAYASCLSSLARKFGVSILAGIVLPEPTIEGGSMQARPRSDLKEITLRFDADGSMDWHEYFVTDDDSIGRYAISEDPLQFEHDDDRRSTLPLSPRATLSLWDLQVKGTVRINYQGRSLEWQAGDNGLIVNAYL